MLVMSIVQAHHLVGMDQLSLTVYAVLLPIFTGGLFDNFHGGPACGKPLIGLIMLEVLTPGELRVTE